jgi:hypothetical protein
MQLRTARALRQGPAGVVRRGRAAGQQPGDLRAHAKDVFPEAEDDGALRRAARAAAPLQPVNARVQRLERTRGPQPFRVHDARPAGGSERGGGARHVRAQGRVERVRRERQREGVRGARERGARRAQDGAVARERGCVRARGGQVRDKQQLRLYAYLVVRRTEAHGRRVQPAHPGREKLAAACLAGAGVEEVQRHAELHVQLRSHRIR